MTAAPARRRVRAALGLAALVLAGVALVLWLLRDDADGVTLPAGRALEVAQLERLRSVPEFTLERLGGQLGAADLRGRWNFVFFGYTNCPDACPETLGILSHVQEGLRAQGTAAPRIVFVSLDAQRDTPKVLHDYLAEFDADAVGATGSAAALQGLLDFFGVTFERRPGQDASSYTLDHTTTFFLLTPDGRWLATFAPADDPDAVLEDTATLLQARW
jgi:protein SCO1/2